MRIFYKCICSVWMVLLALSLSLSLPLSAQAQAVAVQTAQTTQQAQDDLSGANTPENPPADDLNSDVAANDGQKGDKLKGEGQSQTRGDIQAKLDAADKAQAEAYEALRARYETGQAGADGSKANGADDGVSESNADKSKSSLIPKNAAEFKALGQTILNKVLGWLSTPSFLAQIGAIFIIWLLLAPLIAKQLLKRVFFLRDPPKTDDKLFIVRKYIFEARMLVRPILVIGLLALSAVILKGSLGQDWLVKLAQGLAVVFLLYTAIKQFAHNELMQKLGLWILIPLALLGVFGYFDTLLSFLDSLALGGGDDPFSVLTLIKVAIFGSAFFWLGNFSNKKGQTAIRSQESLDIGIREIIAKFLQIVIFGAAAVMAMSAAGIGLSGLVVIFSALSLGIGLGLQPVAANFVSGLIILFDRSVRVGDFVSLDDGREGFVEAINMRSTTVETTDGKDIMVPNTTFIENSYENWTHKDPRQRYEVYFSVAYNTDLDMLEDIVIPVFTAHPSVLDDPEKPDLELREFGKSGINFAVEFWCSGIDDGPNKFTSDLNFAIWRVLKDNNIRMPLPQTEVRLLK